LFSERYIHTYKGGLNTQVGVNMLHLSRITLYSLSQYRYYIVYYRSTFGWSQCPW